MRLGTMRGLAVAAVGLHGLALALLVGTYDGGSPPRSNVAFARVAAPVPAHLSRGVVELSLDAKPVPLPPPPPGAEPPPMPEPRLALSPPPAPVARVDTSPRPAPPRNKEGWLQRVLKSGRAYSAATDRFPADTAGIGR